MRQVQLKCKESSENANLQTNKLPIAGQATKSNGEETLQTRILPLNYVKLTTQNDDKSELSISSSSVSLKSQKSRLTLNQSINKLKKALSDPPTTSPSPTGVRNETTSSSAISSTCSSNSKTQASAVAVELGLEPPPPHQPIRLVIPRDDAAAAKKLLAKTNGHQLLMVLQKPVNGHPAAVLNSNAKPKSKKQKKRKQEKKDERADKKSAKKSSVSPPPGDKKRTSDKTLKRLAECSGSVDESAPLAKLSKVDRKRKSDKLEDPKLVEKRRRRREEIRSMCRVPRECRPKYRRPPAPTASQQQNIDELWSVSYSGRPLSLFISLIMQ